jgi:hypothetical protein
MEIMTARGSHLFAIACASLTLAAGAHAQPTPRLPLRPANARLEHEFTFITSVRELADGRVLVVDEKDNQVFVADFDAQRVRPVGRTGRGPGEFRQVGRLWPLGGDSTLMADPFARRQLVFDGDRIVATRVPNLGRVESGQLLGVDRLGRATYEIHSFTRAGKLTGLRDSMYVLRMTPGGKTDTIARVPSEYAHLDPTKPPTSLSLGAGPRTPRVYTANLVARDQVITFTDGWTAVARTTPYRVDWCAPNARCTASAPIAETPARMTDADKRAYVQRMVHSANWRADLTVSEVKGWTEFIPPFVPMVSQIDASPLRAMPDGRLLIERVPTAAAGACHDIVDRRGARAGQICLPANQRIVGVGRASMYVTETDADNLQWLRRHPWP